MAFRFWFWRGDKIILRGRAPVRRPSGAAPHRIANSGECATPGQPNFPGKENVHIGRYALLFVARHANESKRRQNFGEGWAKWAWRIGRHQRSLWRSWRSGRPRRDARTRQPPRQLETFLS